jgi:hypothetical protein
VENNFLKYMAFNSRYIDMTEINDEIYFTEILAIISAYKEWHRYLEIIYFSITIYSDYKNLEYFAITQVLNCY